MGGTLPGPGRTSAPRTRRPAGARRAASAADPAGCAPATAVAAAVRATRGHGAHAVAAPLPHGVPALVVGTRRPAAAPAHRHPAAHRLVARRDRRSASSLRAQAPPDRDRSPAPTTISDIVTWTADTVYGLVAIWAVVLVLLPLFARGRRRLLLDYAPRRRHHAGRRPASCPGRRRAGGRTRCTRSSPPTRSRSTSSGPLAIATAIVVIASPHVTRPLRWTGRLLVLLGAVAAVALDVTHTLGGLTLIIVGVLAASLTHLLLGTPSGHPTADAGRSSRCPTSASRSTSSTSPSGSRPAPRGSSARRRRAARSSSRSTAATRGTTSSSARCGRR